MRAKDSELTKALGLITDNNLIYSLPLRIMRLTDCQLGDAYQDDVRDAVIKILRDNNNYWEV